MSRDERNNHDDSFLVSFCRAGTVLQPRGTLALMKQPTLFARWNRLREKKKLSPGPSSEIVM